MYMDTDRRVYQKIGGFRDGNHQKGRLLQSAFVYFIGLIRVLVVKLS
jgi:hypothetical protein